MLKKRRERGHRRRLCPQLRSRLTSDEKNEDVSLRDANPED